MSCTASRSAITLKGSVDIVTEFFDYGINSILYQRGIYPSDSFDQVQKYGMSLLMINNEEVKKFIGIILKQLQQFLLTKCVDKLVVVFIDVTTKETLERWDFKIEITDSCKTTDNYESDTDLKDIQKGIRDVIRQITASVTFLPLLDNRCSFDILLYTDKNTCLPSKEWSDSKPHNIVNEQRVQLRSFSTGVHKIDTFVAYKRD